MADDDSTTQDSTGRATVAVVNAKLDGLKDLVRAEFGAMQRQLDAVAALPFKVERLETQNKNQEERIAAQSDRLDALEADRDGKVKADREWRRTHLPAILITLGLLAVAIVTLATQIK